MDKRTACLAAASACRAEAALDPTRRDRWLREASKWAGRALEETGRVMITCELSSETDPRRPTNSIAIEDAVSRGSGRRSETNG
jgi:hypothetical protein